MPSDIFRVCNPSFARQNFQTCEAISHPEVIITVESLGAILIVLFIILYAVKKKIAKKNASETR